jgi:hypothetical protein
MLIIYILLIFIIIKSLLFLFNFIFSDNIKKYFSSTIGLLFWITLIIVGIASISGEQNIEVPFSYNMKAEKILKSDTELVSEKIKENIPWMTDLEIDTLKMILERSDKRKLVLNSESELKKEFITAYAKTKELFIASLTSLLKKINGAPSTEYFIITKSPKKNNLTKNFIQKAKKIGLNIKVYNKGKLKEILIGPYTTKKEAYFSLKEIKKFFPQSYLTSTENLQ